MLQGAAEMAAAAGGLGGMPAAPAGGVAGAPGAPPAVANAQLAATMPAQAPVVAPP